MNGNKRTLIGVLPIVFVFLWSTGFIAGKFALPYIQPFTLIFFRMIFSLLGMIPIILWARPVWPKSLKAVTNLAVSGILTHALFQGGIFYAIKWKLPAGITALVIGLQPVLTALVVCTFFKDKISRIQWSGIMLGFLGVSLVVGTKVLSAGVNFGAKEIGCAVMGLIGLSFGTIYQKKQCNSMNILTGTFIQYCSAAGVAFVFSLTYENLDIEWSRSLVLSLAWLVGPLSIGAVSILAYLINNGSISTVASFFYFVPPLTATWSFFLFNERMNIVMFMGMLVAVAGVYLVVNDIKVAAFLVRNQEIPTLITEKEEGI